MDNPEKKSKWDDLARELGAEAPPEPAVEAKPAGGVDSESRESRRRIVEPPPRPKADPRSWDSLATNLGVDVPPPAALSETVESKPRRDETAGRSENLPPRRHQRPRREDAERAEDRPSRPPQDEPPRRRRRDEEPSARAEQAQPPAPEPSAEPKAAPGTSMGVSLWHKIFGSPEQQAERIAESKAAPDAERVETPDEPYGRRGRRHEESPGDTALEAVEIDVSWNEQTVETSFEDAAEAVKSEGPSAEPGGEPRPRRRRRGRGRGRGPRREDEPGREPRADDRPARRSAESRQGDESPALRESRGRGRGRPRREETPKFDAKDDLDDGLEEIVLDDEPEMAEAEMTVDGGGARPASGRTAGGHKSIPSWDEAIGMIVETNLATRTDRRRSAPQGRGSGSSRGRSRGGRRRKKS
jgi:hypothetical protein